MKHPHAEFLKPLITNDRIEIQAKGQDQVFTNFKKAVAVGTDKRRYCVFYTPQQVEAPPGRWVYDLPVPMHATKPLEMGQEYYLFDVGNEPDYALITWEDDESDHRWLQAGLIYLTEADVKKRVKSFRIGKWVPVEDKK